MFKVSQTNNKEKFKTFSTKDEAESYIKRQKRAVNFYTLEEVDTDTTSKHSQNVPEIAATTMKTKKVAWKLSTDFSDAVEVNRTNVKQFYKKSGYIRIISKDGKTILHTGKTKNMGKVFSNYVNCAKYHQSYDFNLDGGDKLYFKESEI